LLDRASTLAAIGPDRIHPRVIDAILAFAFRMAYIRERASQPGTSATGLETLKVLDERLSLEIAAAGGPSAVATTPR
jgi:hypothetical protein